MGLPFEGQGQHCGSEEGNSVADNNEHATLKYPGGELDLDIVHATEGADGIALGSLLSKTGYTSRQRHAWRR